MSDEIAKTSFYLGGARSGKSRIAQEHAEQLSSSRVYVATAQALDDEMAARIAHHQQDRHEGWTTVEAPLELGNAVRTSSTNENVVVIDCLTLWLSNLMHLEHNLNEAYVDLEGALKHAPGPVLLVSNEVGLGLVPETPLGRAFRDEQGRLNQRIAKLADHVVFVAAGLTLPLKG